MSVSPVNSNGFPDFEARICRDSAKRAREAKQTVAREITGESIHYRREIDGTEHIEIRNGAITEVSEKRKGTMLKVASAQFMTQIPRVVDLAKRLTEGLCGMILRGTKPD